LEGAPKSLIVNNGGFGPMRPDIVFALPFLSDCGIVRVDSEKGRPEEGWSLDTEREEADHEAQKSANLGKA